MKRLILASLSLVAVGALHGKTAEAIGTSCRRTPDGFVDVLSLGVKNDGSEDVSSIVNAWTEKAALLFPAGVYKVSKPLVLLNPVRGAGYCRNPSAVKGRTRPVGVPDVNPGYTWFVSDISCADASCGVIEFTGNVRMNVEKLNIRCKSRECGIRIAGCQQNTSTYISEVGIYAVAATGLLVDGRGSRPVFAADMTIFGAISDPTSRAVGIRIKGSCDCRLSNIEVMGTCIGLEILNGHTYGNNLHIWTGIMGRYEPGWWSDTRGVVIGDNAHFQASEIYPDTSYYAFDLRGPGALCEISNVMYWEDGSVKAVTERTGVFLRHADPDNRGKLLLNGGLIGVGGSDANPGATEKYYMPGAVVRDVIMKSVYSIRNENIDRLCLGGVPPDYTVRYADAGWCKVADIFTLAKTGACEADLSLDDGAAWKLTFTKDASGHVGTSVTPLNALCAGRKVETVQEDGIVKVFVCSPDDTPMSARFATRYMCDYFRPLDHGSLRDMSNRSRYRDVRRTLAPVRTDPEGKM
jgi:hypothetical protein